MGALYLARWVLIPIALATLLTFRVHPLVGRLIRLGLGRGLSVGLVVTMLFATLGGWPGCSPELAVLSTHTPAYRATTSSRADAGADLGLPDSASTVASG